MVTSPPTEQPRTTATVPVISTSGDQSRRWKQFGLVAGALTLLFGKVLFDLFVYGLNTSVYSHILLIPAISLYLVWQKKHQLPALERSSPALPLFLSVLGLAVLGAWAVLRATGTQFSQNDYLSYTTFSYVLLFAAAAIWTLGKPFAASVAFPLTFLIFMVPFPDRVTALLETASQHSSAEVYSWMMDLSQATYFRQGLIFALPNLTIEVAQECSGIRSSMVLFITSLLAANMFLTTPWKRAVLALAVFPLGIARNAFRIYILSMLSAHWDPRIIHSPLHSQGGPIFFVLSLIPFFALLVWLRKTEKS